VSFFVVCVCSVVNSFFVAGEDVDRLATGSALLHSYLSGTIGSTVAARRAGM
jgi:hypothetical protein